MPTPLTTITTDLRDAAGVGLTGELFVTVTALVRFPTQDQVYPGMTTTFDVKNGIAYKKGTTTPMALPATAIGAPVDVPLTLVFKPTGGDSIILGDFVIPDSPTAVNLADIVPVVVTL